MVMVAPFLTHSVSTLKQGRQRSSLSFHFLFPVGIVAVGGVFSVICLAQFGHRSVGGIAGTFCDTRKLM